MHTPVTVASSPTVLRRYIALELLRLRVASGLKREAVAVELRRTPGHIRHLETMHHPPSSVEVRALLALYDAADRTEDFLSLLDAARRGKDWWETFPGEVPKWLDLLLGMESAASRIDCYDTMAVTGLCQTPAYAEAIIRAGEPKLPDAEVQQRVELRMARQDVLTRPDPPTVWCVMDEAVLHHQPRNPAVLAEQLEHLVKLADLPNVHLQVIPFGGVGLNAGVNGTFTILTFGPELVGDPGVVYTESRITGTYYEQPEHIQRYRDTFTSVQQEALNQEESRAILARRVEEITA